MGDDAWRKRQLWAESVIGLRDLDAITEADRETLFREYDGMQQAIQDELHAAAPEFGRLARDEGRDAAEAWMHARMHALGVERGRRLKQVLAGLSIADQLELDRSA
ncbi:hypothetical protein E4582_00660 [Luteimonas yindakuii]|uniref:Uncharacterized protein n=1 Tax=Luteimonas yindakuii TaxID=2565782 RepID=A0A4Z1R9Q4_9GAMM|nr:hypothetical protein [Luteimonas yindakuii]QCO67239.1 hypothetical protein E5843_04565 [Luteimonas yindakuii]TKS53428.1 hypothetical protein E4582_00660 [Luteimonas yindakuii]